MLRILVADDHGIVRSGLIMLGCGEAAIRFCPPLCITQPELETGLALFDQAVASVQ